MKGNSKSLLISIFGAIISVFLINYYITSKEASLLELSAPVDVVTAIKDVQEGTRLEDGLFEIKSVPKLYLQPGAIMNIDEIRDRVSAVAILKDNQVLGSMLAKNQDIGLSRKIPRGKTAQTVSVDSVSGIAGLLQPGDYVDIIVTVEVEASPGVEGQTATETVSKRILQNIQVLAVDQRSHRSANSGSTSVLRNGPGNRVSATSNVGGGLTRGSGVSTVTVLLADEQVLPLSLAQQVGRISLALRSAWFDSNNAKAELVESDDNRELGSYELLGISKPIAKDYYDVFSRARRSRHNN